MGLPRARRVSARASQPGFSSISTAGRKPHADGHKQGWNLKAIGLCVLLIASLLAAIGMLRVENMRLKTTLGQLKAAASTPVPVQSAAPPPAPTPVAAAIATPKHLTSSSEQQSQQHEAEEPEPQARQPAAAAPVPDELPSAKVATPATPSYLEELSAGAPVSFIVPASTASTAAQQFSEAAAAAAAKRPAVSMPKNRLLLATHSRLMWYFPDSDEHLILHEGEGVHYGMFPGAGSPPTTVWTAIRPHNWRPTSNKEWLVELDMVTGEELRRVAVPSRFTHDVVRADDSVFVCDTGNGRILQLSFPDMTPVRSIDLFTLKDHPNTLAPLAPDNFLVMLHNLGESDIVRVNVSAVPLIEDPQAWLAAEALKLDAQDTHSADATSAETQNPNVAPGAVVGRVQRVGQKAHGLVPWQGAYILLDSDNGALMALDLTGAAAGQGFNLHKLWQAPEQGVFLKGLTVVDDIAYFGISPWAPRSARDDPQSSNELAAFDLISGALLWRRQVPTAGLLNIVGAPHLAVGSTYLPSYTGRSETDAVRKHHSSPEVAAAMQSLNEIGYPPRIGGYWSSGLPFLDADMKGTKRPWEAGLQLPLLMLNISKLQAAVAALPKEAWTYEYQAKYSAVMAGREGNQNAFKPGVEGIVLLFSANDGHGPVYKFPAYDYFKDAIEPLLEEILGKRDMQHVIRLQLALMKPGVSDIKIHVDSGGYAIRGHRLHIPVFTHPDVSFDVCPHRYVPDPTHVPGPGEQQRILDIQECFKIPTVEGFAFELNNRAAHKVSNLSPVERVHVVFDLCEEPHPRVNVPRGTICDYDMEKGLLCQYPDGSTPVVMSPAAYLDPAAAAAESREIPPEMLQQVTAQQEEDNGSGYTPADDATGNAMLTAAVTTDGTLPTPSEYDEKIQAPVAAPAGVKYAVNLQGEHLTHPGLEHEVQGAQGMADVGLVGTVRNGHTSTWLTEAMRGPGGVASVATA